MHDAQDERAREGKEQHTILNIASTGKMMRGVHAWRNKKMLQRGHLQMKTISEEDLEWLCFIRNKARGEPECGSWPFLSPALSPPLAPSLPCDDCHLENTGAAFTPRRRWRSCTACFCSTALYGPQQQIDAHTRARGSTGNTQGSSQQGNTRAQVNRAHTFRSQAAIHCNTSSCTAGSRTPSS